MMRLLLLVGLAAVGLIAYHMAAPLIVDEQASAPIETITAIPDIPVASAQKASRPAVKVAPPAARVIAPETITTPPVDLSALERLAPRPPLDGSGDANTGAWEKTLLFRSVAVSAGIIEAGGHRIRIAGIVPTDPDNMCRTNDGAERPCGRMARTAFRNWLRARAVECKVPKKPLPGEIRTSCTLAGVDVASWLVENGWARAEQDGALAELQREAESSGRGLFTGVERSN